MIVMNLPNKLTLLRVFLIPIFVYVLLATYLPFNRYIATAIFIIASLTDFLDGYLARKLNLVTNFGKFMDPLADKLLVCAALICFVEIKELPAWIVIIIISREFIITGFRLIAVEANIVLAASWLGKVKTATQMAMIIYISLGIKGYFFEIFGDMLVFFATIFTIISGIDYIVKNIQVLK